MGKIFDYRGMPVGVEQKENMNVLVIYLQPHDTDYVIVPGIDISMMKPKNIPSNRTVRQALDVAKKQEAFRGIY